MFYRRRLQCSNCETVIPVMDQQPGKINRGSQVWIIRRAADPAGVYPVRLKCIRIRLECTRIRLECTQIRLECTRIRLECTRIRLECARIRPSDPPLKRQPGSGLSTEFRIRLECTRIRLECTRIRPSDPTLKKQPGSGADHIKFTLNVYLGILKPM